MLTAITIKNFRLFEKLEVKRLGRVTLLVGKNNSGKSSFLEALLLYLNEPSFYILQDLVSFRQDHTRLQTIEYDLSKRPIQHLFYNHKFPVSKEEGLFIAGKKNPEKSYSLQVFAQELVTDTRTDYVLMAERNKTKDVVWSESIELQEIKQNRPHSASGHLSVGGTLFANLNREKFQFIPTIGLPDWVASNMWDQVLLTDIEKDVIKTLKIIEPNLEKIVFISFPVNDDMRERTPKVKVSGLKEPVTLRSLGDGVTKLFHILISIANAKDGTLLIDEFENGFHWSVQEKVWTAVFDLAEKLNVQVFATTHSRDCVQAFSKVWSKNEEEGAFIRLENNEGVVRAEEYNSRSLATSIRAEVEVR